MVLFLLLATCLLAVFIVYYIRHRRIKKLIDRFPGPKSYPLLGNILQFWGTRGELFRNLTKITEDYQSFPTFRLWVGWIPRIFVIKAQAAEAILSSSQLIDKADVYNYLHPWLGAGLLLSGSIPEARSLVSWKEFRSYTITVLTGYQEHLLVSFLADSKLNKYGEALIGEVGLAIDETAMGRSVSAQHNRDSPYVKAVNDMGEIFLKRAMYPWLAPDWLFSMTSLGALQRKSLKLLHGFTNKVIGERRLEKLNRDSSHANSEDIGQKRRLAFLDLILEPEFNLSDKDIREEVDTFMFEGHDTTSSGVNWVLYILGKYPEVQKKVCSELKEVLGEDSTRSLTTDDMRRMKYLECVIKETMRLYPPVPYIGRKFTKDTEICGQIIPANVDISISMYNIHRDPEFHNEPDKFDPDRFKPENLKHKNPYAYIPFSAGPRNCIGQKFAFMEEKVLVAEIVRHFWITLSEPEAELDLLPELVLRPEKGMWLTLKKSAI